MKKYLLFSLVVILSLVFVSCIPKPPVQEDAKIIVKLPDTLPSTVTEIYMAGNINNWSFTDEYKYQIKEESGNKYIEVVLDWDSLTYPVEYKFAYSNDWSAAEKSDGMGDIGNRMIQEKPTEDFVNVVLNFNGLTEADYSAVSAEKDVSFSLSVPDTTPASSVYIVGDFNSWTVAASPMTLNAQTGKYEISFKVDSYKYYGYKYVIDGTWDHVEKNADGTEKANRVLIISDNAEIKDKVLKWLE